MRAATSNPLLAIRPEGLDSVEHDLGYRIAKVSMSYPG